MRVVLARATYFAAVLLTALTAGLEFAHVLEWPQKAHYPAELYSRLQESLYIWFGNLGGVVFVLAVLGGLATAWLFRGSPGRGLIATAAGLQLVGLVVFLTVVYPVNAHFPVDGPTVVVPTGWEALRTRWELGHTLGFGLFAVAFVLLMLAWPAAATESRRSLRAASGSR